MVYDGDGQLGGVPVLHVLPVLLNIKVVNKFLPLPLPLLLLLLDDGIIPERLPTADLMFDISSLTEGWRRERGTLVK